jgi:hypothetical protein
MAIFVARMFFYRVVKVGSLVAYRMMFTYHTKPFVSAPRQMGKFSRPLSICGISRFFPSEQDRILPAAGDVRPSYVPRLVFFDTLDTTDFTV